MSSAARGRVLRSFSFPSNRFCFCASSYARTSVKLLFHPSRRNKSFHSGLSKTRFLHARDSVEERNKVSGLRYDRIWKVISGGRCITGSRWRSGFSFSTMSAIDAVRNERRMAYANSWITLA
jgi:hypothetical protein